MEARRTLARASFSAVPLSHGRAASHSACRSGSRRNATAGPLPGRRSAHPAAGRGEGAMAAGGTLAIPGPRPSMGWTGKTWRLANGIKTHITKNNLQRKLWYDPAVHLFTLEPPRPVSQEGFIENGMAQIKSVKEAGYETTPHPLPK